jgi:hypothetical protein
VDVALGVYPIKYKMKHPKLSTVVLVSGDGDLISSIKCLNAMKETETSKKVKTYVASWSASSNISFADEAYRKIYLDEIFLAISVPDMRNRADKSLWTNGDFLREEGMPHQIIVAATHRYPYREDLKKCREFAEVLKKVYESNSNYRKIW